MRPCQGEGGGPMSLASILKMSRVHVYKCFTSLSEIERKFFAEFYERGIAMRCKETISVLFLS